jgi:N-acetylglucosaminyldiphosphoundecaprenol N-acetyl-beta-D-mannosaminyltransferase
MHPRVNILGVGVSAINLGQAVAAIDQWILDRQLVYVCVAAAHSLMDCRRDPVLRKVYNNAAMVTPDGMSLVWNLRLRGHSYVNRVYGPDFLMAVCENSLERGYRHFLYGGTELVLSDLQSRLRHQFPGLEIAGVFAPPFVPMTSEETQQAIDSINQSAADLVWVGIGTPKQERWMAEHRGQVATPVMIGVGAAFDFLSGHKPQAPRWIRRSGLEWIFRLASEPRRLWPRYREYPLFVALALAQLLRLRKFPFEN